MKCPHCSETITDSGSKIQLPKLAIVVLDKGFIYIGFPAIVEDFLIIREARNIRVWGTEGKGLGCLGIEGPQSDTKLDVCPDIFAPFRSVIHLMPCNEDRWPLYKSA